MSTSTQYVCNATDSHRIRSTLHRLSFMLTQEGEPRHTLCLRAIMQSQNPADHILIYRSPKCQINLLRDTWTAPRRIALFHSDNRANHVRVCTFWPGLGLLLSRKQDLVLSPNQSAWKSNRVEGLNAIAD